MRNERSRADEIFHGEITSARSVPSYGDITVVQRAADSAAPGNGAVIYTVSITCHRAVNGKYSPFGHARPCVSVVPVQRQTPRAAFNKTDMQSLHTAIFHIGIIRFHIQLG